MTPRSLVYVVLAVAVGYILVSAVPQQVAMYTTPKRMFSGPVTSAENLSEGSDMNVLGTPESSQSTESMKVPGDDSVQAPYVDPVRMLELMKWWTVDILVALSIYWVARRRFT